MTEKLVFTALNVLLTLFPFGDLSSSSDSATYLWITYLKITY